MRINRREEQDRNTAARRVARLDPVSRRVEQDKDTEARRKARLDPATRFQKLFVSILFIIFVLTGLKNNSETRLRVERLAWTQLQGSKSFL